MRLKSNVTLKDCLSEGAKITKKCYGTGFDLRSEFSLPDGSVCKNAVI